MTILFLADSVRSFFSSRPQYAILGTGILGQIASFERRLRGAAQTSLALAYPFRTWPGSGTWADRDKREVLNFFYILGGIRPSYSWILAYAELERKKQTRRGQTFISKLASFPNWLLISSPPHFFHGQTSKRSAYCRTTALSLLIYIGFQG